jgi:hypothetical protein
MSRVISRVIRVIRKKRRVRPTKYRHVETPRPFQPTFPINDVNQPPIEVEQADHKPVEVEQAHRKPVEVKQAHREPVTDYMDLAIKAAKALYQKTSLDHIDNVAAGLFKFDKDPHLHVTMPDVVAQEIFNWIITLSEQPIRPQAKLRLARKFIVSLDPETNPVENQESSVLVWPQWATPSKNRKHYNN